MGTFTKSFASAGGYICSDKKLITYLRRNSYSSMCEVAMSVPLAQQIISSLSIIMGKDGTNDGQRRYILYFLFFYFRTYFIFE